MATSFLTGAALTGFLYDALGHTRRFTYDAGGLLTTSTDALGQVIAYGYDPLGRKTQEKWYASVGNYGTGAASRTTTWSYDVAGQLYAVTDQDANNYYSYDAQGQRTQEAEVVTDQIPPAWSALATRSNQSLNQNVGGIPLYIEPLLNTPAGMEVSVTLTCTGFGQQRDSKEGHS